MLFVHAGRRHWRVVLSLIFSAVVLAAAERRPNVVLVMTDDHGYGDLGLHGNPHVRTPHLDRFGRDGVRFTRFYVSPLCSPTRASLLTGRYHYRTGVLHTSRGAAKMHGDEVTVAEQLRAAGYRTGIFGKWHLGDNFPMRPSDQGFEESLIHKSGAINTGPDQPSSYFDPRLWHNNAPLQTQGYCTDVFFTAALRFIEENRARPFFVYLPTNVPHAPLDITDRYVAPYKAMGLSDRTARFYGMVENMDENFGRLLETLERLGLRENTLVVFLTDNGPAGEKRFDAGLRGNKGQVYEGGIRVPCFIQWPARFAGGRTSDRIAAHIDLMPTILDASDAPPPATHRMDGTSLLPLLTDATPASRWPERTLFIQFHRGLEVKRYQHFAAITQRFKLIGYPGTHTQEDLDTSGQPPVLELYDLAADPGEKREVSAAHPEVRARLLHDYEAWFDDVRRTRNFLPGTIHLGAAAEPAAHLSRYQDGGYPGGVATGWKVRVLNGGRYEITFVRGPHPGAANLVVAWAGRTQRQPLPEGRDSAQFELTAGEGILDIWLEGSNGVRLPYSGNEKPGDAILRRL